MADWVICTRATEKGDSIAINLDKVDCIMPHTKGSCIVFSGLEKDSLTVSEKPYEIMTMDKVR